VSVGIRSKSINGPDCPTEDPSCYIPVNYFEITVQKRGMGEAQPVYVHVYGLDDTRHLDIYRVYADRCDPLYSRMYCGGQAMGLTCDSPDILLTLPGTYRFQTSDNTNLNWDADFAYEQSPIHAEYAQLYLQQQSLCCCRESLLNE